MSQVEMSANRTPQPNLIAASVPETDSIQSGRALKRMALIAWLSILLGLVMQGLVLLAKTALGPQPESMQVIVDFAQGITWAFFVCAGIGFGTAIARGRSAIGGAVGLISAPAAVGLAKGSQKVMGSALGMANKPAILSLLTVGSLRALEYGFLGWMLASLAAKANPRFSRFVGVGAAAGIIFGGAITFLTIHAAGLQQAHMATPQVVALVLNEMLFPVGCSFVVYLALNIGQHVKLVTARPTGA